MVPCACAKYFIKLSFRSSASRKSLRFPSLSGGITDDLPGVDGVGAGEGDHGPALLAGAVPVRAGSGRCCWRVGAATDGTYTLH